MISSVSSAIIEEDPALEPSILSALKAYKNQKSRYAEPEYENVLTAYGYRQSDFINPLYQYVLLLAVAGFTAGSFLFLAVFITWRKKEELRIQTMAEALEKSIPAVRTSSWRRGKTVFQNCRMRYIKQLQ